MNLLFVYSPEYLCLLIFRKLSIRAIQELLRDIEILILLLFLKFLFAEINVKIPYLICIHI